MMIINEYEMTDGDLVDYTRAQQRIAAMNSEALRHPWRAKALRAMMHAETARMGDIVSRYGQEV
jgi:hypothetical protein